jgi:transposase
VFLDGQLERLDELIVPLVTARAPGLLALYGIGPNTAALLLIAAGDHPGRLRSEAAWAHLCAAAPIPASSGKATRHRLNPGGDRQANHALWRIVFTRMGSDAATRAYVERAQKKESPRQRSSAAGSVTSPAKSTRTCALTPTPRGRPDPIFGCREPAGLRTIRRLSPASSLTCWA